MSNVIERRWAWLIAAASAMLYIALLPLYDIGVFNDDSLYVLAARSLLSGRYASLHLPGQPLTSHPSPGVPLLLALFIKGIQPHWSLLEWIPLAITLVSAFLYRKLLRRYMSSVYSLIGMALFALNPITAHFSGVVMAESFLFFFVMLSFVLVQEMMRSYRPWHPYALGVLLGWTSLMRPEAVIIIPSVAAGLLYARHKRSSVIVFGVSMSLWLMVLLRNFVQTQSLELEYSHEALDVLRYWSQHQTSLFLHAKDIAGIFCQGNLLGLFFPNNPGGHALDFFLLVLTAALGMIGLKSFSKNTSRPDRGLLLTIGCFGYFYFGIHAVWGISDARYFLPLMPFALLFLLRGTQTLAHQKKYYGGLSAVGLAGLLVVYSYQDGYAVYESLLKTPWNNLAPFQTLKMIQRQTPPEAIFLSPLGPTMYLYAGRSNINLVRNKDEDDFRYEIFKKGVTYILDRPILFTSATNALDPNQEWKRMRRWLRLYPQHFPAIYRNEKEETRLYRVTPDASFVPAYEEYQAALEDLSLGHEQAGLKKLEHVLRSEPDFASALNAYGATLLLLRQNLGLAARLLERAVRVRPAYPLALLNLSDVYHMRGQQDLADEYLQKSVDASRVMLEEESFETVIERHQKQPITYRSLFPALE